MKNEHTPDDIGNLILQPVSRDKHAGAVEQVHKIIARNHGFDPNNKDAFQGWDTVQTQDTVGKIFDGMDIVPGRRWHGDAGAGRDWNCEHHAGISDRAHARNWIDESAGRDEPAHSDAVLSGRRVSYRAERRHWHCDYGRRDGDSGASCQRLRASICRILCRHRRRWRWVRFRLRALWRACIRRGKLHCCSRWKR